MKRNREVEADMISDVKVEAALKMKKLLLLGDYDNEFMAFRRILNAKSLRNMCTKGLQWATDVFLAVSFLFWDWNIFFLERIILEDSEEEWNLPDFEK